MVFLRHPGFVSERLVGECETAHAGLDAEDVVVDGPHLEGVAGLGRVDASLDTNIDLSVVDAREVAGAGRLVLLGLEGERVAVDTRVRVAGVVPVGLDAVEKLAGLVLEAVLTVEDETEGRERADSRDASGVGAGGDNGLTVLRHGHTNAAGGRDEHGRADMADWDGRKAVGRGKVGRGEAGV